MSGADVYRKTEKGRGEIATRADRLGLRERTMLIMVDDRSTRAELLVRNSHPSSAAILDELLARAYIEIVTDTAPSAETAPEPPRQPSARPPTAEAAPGVEISVTSAARYACRALVTYLGPSADELTAMVEKARDAGELAKVLAKCREVILAMAGRKKADDFWAGVSARLPQA